jgi:hypothetical protein
MLTVDFDDQLPRNAGEVCKVRPYADV